MEEQEEVQEETVQEETLKELEEKEEKEKPQNLKVNLTRKTWEWQWLRIYFSSSHSNRFKR
jgi:hypothetical protein